MQFFQSFLELQLIPNSSILEKCLIQLILKLMEFVLILTYNILEKYSIQLMIDLMVLYFDDKLSQLKNAYDLKTVTLPRISTDDNLMHPLNKLASIIVTFSGITIDCKLVLL